MPRELRSEDGGDKLEDASEIVDRDGTGTLKTKLRSVALLETPLKLIEFIAVDQHADHTVSQQQNRQVGLRRRHGSEATVRAVRRLW